MPANFGEIANYHQRLAAQHLALAKAARDAGDINTAEYNHQLAARYVEAAEEQRMAMSVAPGQQAAYQTPCRLATETNCATTRAPKLASKPSPKRIPIAVTCLSALCRGAGSVAASLQQSLTKANASLQGLALTEPSPAPAPQMRG
jgi:hypothetical protein